MKKFLSAALAALLLLGLLPVMTPPAGMATAGFVRPTATSAFPGDTIIWNTYGSSQYPGSTGFFRQIVLYINGVFDTSLTVNSLSGTVEIETFISQTGRYDVIYRVWDSFSDDVSYSQSVIVTLRPAPKNVKVEAVNGTTLKVTWAAVPGATGYEVWRSEYKAGPYANVAEVTATSWTNTSLTPGKLYYYKIRSTNMYSIINRVVSGNFSAPAAAIPLAKAAITGATGIAKDRIKLAIKPVPGASGYQILVSAKAAGPYKVLKKVTTAAPILTGLKPNTVYYFKAIAYRTVSAGTFYAPISAYKAGRTLK